MPTTSLTNHALCAVLEKFSAEKPKITAPKPSPFDCCMDGGMIPVDPVCAFISDWTLRHSRCNPQELMKQVATIGGSKAWTMNPHDTDPFQRHAVVPPREDATKPTLFLDIDETLLHSTFNPDKEKKYDFDFWVDIDGEMRHCFGDKRPGVEEFLQKASQRWELVAWTASIAAYANKVLNILDPDGVLFWRLFRDSCVSIASPKTKARVYAKDLSIAGRTRTRSLLLDNSPNCYIFQPEQGIPIESWFDDQSDDYLLKLLPVLDNISEHDDVIKGLRDALPWYEGGKEGCSGPVPDPYDGVDWDGLPKSPR